MRFLRLMVCVALFTFALLPLWCQTPAALSATDGGSDSASLAGPVKKLPSGVILVKGAWPSASDSATPVPESGSVTNNIFRSPYFGITYDLPQDWIQKYEGPPPSDSGRYVLAQIVPGETFKGATRASILITAQDMFFTPFPVENALQLTDYSKDHLESQYKLETPPTDMKIAGHVFRFYSYLGPASQLHWYIASTQIRCHAVDFVLTGSDTKLLDTLMHNLNEMKLPAEADDAAGTGGDFPVCMKDYARPENLISRADPIFTEHRFNSVPVRITIDKEGKIKHAHFLRAFPDQMKAITDALGQWKFKPYVVDGHPVEVETGIMFGRWYLKPTAVARESETATTVR